MSTYDNLETAAFLPSSSKTVFAHRQWGLDSQGISKVATVFVGAAVGVVLAAVLACAPFGGSGGAQADDIHIEKTDRNDQALPKSCEGQAWGAWSADCAAAISGNGSVRKISFVTVEQSVPSTNTTVLTRVQTNG